MPRVFRLTGDQVGRVTTNFFPSHDALRKAVEGNLEILFGLRYMESNFHLVDLPADAPRECREVDTLAFDPRTYAPVAIEFRDRSTPELLAQGVAMMHAMPTQSQVLKYLVKRAGFNPDRIEWGKMRVIFLAREAVAPMPVPSRSLDGGVELWECQLYAGDFLVLDHAVTFPASAKRPETPKAAAPTAQ
jgi:hypothetical protein